MPRYLIVPERSRIDLTARPDLPGLRLVIDEVSGAVDSDAARASAGAPTDPGGDAAPTPPVETAAGAANTLTLWLQAVIDDGHRAAGVPDWLRHGELVAVTGELEELRCEPDDRIEVSLRFRLAERVIPFTGAGRVVRGPDPDDPIEAVGVTLVDPRVLGFGLPPLVTYAIHARWRLVLAAEPG